ncbi:MAG: RNA-binding protein [Patescibacteria group bacterium]
MQKRLFVGNLPYQIDNSQLETLFSQCGQVVSANVIMDRMTGRAKGFAFVEMSTEEEAQNAIQTLNGKDLEGRAIVVNEAKPQESRDNRFQNQSNSRRYEHGSKGRQGKRW